MKTTVVTGCDHGLGVEVAKACLLRGDRVFAICYRSRSAGEIRRVRKAFPKTLTILAADLSSEEHSRLLLTAQGILAKGREGSSAVVEEIQTFLPARRS